MHRFFVKQKINNSFVLDKDLIHHLKVARLFNEEFLVNFETQFYRCCYNKNTNFADIIEKLNINNEYQNDLVLAAPIIKGERFEWMIEKATELGVKTIIPMTSQFCNFKYVELNFKNEKKYLRYNTKIQQAAQQSFRNIIPTITEVNSLREIVVEYLKRNYNIYIAYESLGFEHQINTIKTNSLILVGPEGGLSEDEFNWIKSLKSNQIYLVSLGKRILRAESAAISMLALVKE
ncbi:16S rRNA (uracil(1498)-N(3))-methyltransferase [Mycoplasmopsis phocirhinis]|uniref:Ribosomal RNA small subunit methyltransferase E n=1 Tax=Mycoplasmopsis phocirhinis TaxID=142650 RepID=A0A4P6MQZ8_9BACT|nr:16S rRNA (uracil(1498)-N(3))-methyltransferase [Mycoplasmopsis phocirhinis]QBF34499.1 16S rRNA (uracil(1498)-N(3))-methyltransferase [Mycoplasmopsis phocirhinis]